MVRPAEAEAVKLFHEGLIAFSQMEQNGVLIDREYLNKAMQDTGNQIQELEAKLKSDKVFKLWKRRFGDKASLGSKIQLEKIVFDELGFKRTGRETDKGRVKTDESAFEFVDHPFVKDFFRLEKLKKVRGTYLSQLEREMDESGYIHPFVNLHTTISYRSSIDRPSFQNLPIRDPIQGELVRRAIVAPKGYRVGEIDFSGNEVRWSVVYHKDPKMREYILDPTTDMHRDMAMECYRLKKKEVSKMARYVAKNRFVFPQFYGSYWYDCAQNMWEAIDLYKIKTEDGIPLKKHLKRKGIKKLGDCGRNDREPQSGTFQRHLMEVEKDFWGNRFQVYDQWKKDLWVKFCKRGWLRYKTGFVASGLLNRKQVCNYPIQGSAFHGLLWCLIELQKWLNKHNMKSRIILQIHDSILMYLWKTEIADVLQKAKEIMTVRMLKHWKFLDIPFEIEAEVSPKGKSWFEKEKYEL